MIPGYFAIIGAAVASIGGFYYLYETVTGKAKPNRVTWFLWGLLPMITFIAQRVQGVEGLSWVTFAAGFTPFLILLASFLNKKAYWKTERRDYYIMAAAVLGILLWAVTDKPNVAILFAIVADFLAGLPTLIKAYLHPETESWAAYALCTLGFALGILAIHVFTFENYAFVVYLFAMNGSIAVLSFRNKKRLAAVAGKADLL